MAKTLTESPITTRNARKGLPLGLHWRGLDPDVHIGYRKAKRGGRWLVRWYAGDQKYRQATIGTADDVIGEGTLSFEAASKIARDTVTEARRAEKAVATGPIPTVRLAVESYIAARDARDTARAGRSVRSDAASRLTRHVLSDARFADIELHALTEAHLKGWRARIDPELKGSTRQRLVNDLKAALNAAYQDHRSSLPPDLTATIKHGLKAVSDAAAAEPVARDNQILQDAEVRRIIETAVAMDADGDLARLIIVLAATGARFSQVARMQVRDVQVSQFRLLVPTSRKGKARTAGHTPIQVKADIIKALEPAIAEREPSEPLLERWKHVQVSGKNWERAGRGPWKSASEMGRSWHAIVKAAGLPNVMPYALRHSSIVRGIRFNLPIRLVAALHDTSVAMIERHYSRWIADGLEELAARAAIPLLQSDQ